MDTPNEFFMEKDFPKKNTPHPTNEEETSNMHDDIDILLHDTFRNVVEDLIVKE